MSFGRPQRKNRALLIVMKSFHTRCPLPSRSGAGADARKLFRVLSDLGFTVTLHFDLTAQEVTDAYQEEIAKEQGDCFLSVLSSHGEEGLVFGFDGCPVKLTDIFSMFTPRRCPKLVGKTKMFFVQACRGEMLDPGVEVETDGGSDTQEDSFSHYLSIPSDTTVMFASSPGYGAFLNPGGSVFLQTLCELLSSEAHKLELLRLLTRVSHRVAYEFEARGRFSGSRAMPCIVTRMTMEVFPFAKQAVHDQVRQRDETPYTTCNEHPEGHRDTTCTSQRSKLKQFPKANSVEIPAIYGTNVWTQLGSLNLTYAGTLGLKAT